MPELNDFIPKSLPNTWKRINPLPGFPHLVYLSNDMLRVLMTIEIHDGKNWLHVSCARKSKLPSWDDLGRTKNLFIGSDKLALQVFPPQSEYVNDHKFTLHLWHCIDQRPLPDFRNEGSV